MPASIVQQDNPILRQIARKLSVEEILSPLIQGLIQLMKETVSGLGVGLAAPQIGESLQLAVIEDTEAFIQSIPPEIRAERGRRPVPFHVIINPIIVYADIKQAYFFEGCLSIKDDCRITPRAERVIVECLNEKAQPVTIEANGWYARILQHEIDHLNGRLCIDKGEEKTRVTMEDYRNHWLFALKAEIEAFYQEKLKER